MGMSAGQAFAGKQERAFRTEVETTIKAGESAVKTNCGCSFTAKIDWDSFKTEDHMRLVKYTFSDFDADSKTYCTDADSKKAVCKMKTISLSYGAKDDLTFANGTVKIVTGGGSYKFDAIAKLLDN
jgi:hypothetical protein